MVTIYLYDDTPGHAGYVEQLNASAERYQVEAKVITFAYRNSMLKHIAKNPRQADIIFITADGRNFDCLETVRRARELGSRAIVVIYGRGIYGAGQYENAGHYLKAPFTEADFDRMFLKVCSEYDENRNRSLEVMIGKMPEKLPIPHIRYLEVNNRIVNAYVEQKIYTFYASLSELEEALRRAGFIRVHRGYLVNMDYIREARSSRVVMEDGTVIPVGRNYKMDVKKQLMGKG